MAQIETVKCKTDPLTSIRKSLSTSIYSHISAMQCLSEENFVIPSVYRVSTGLNNMQYS